MSQMQIGNPRKVHGRPVVVAVDLSGGIEGKHYEKIDRSLSALWTKGVRFFVFDLSGVRFVNEPDQLAERHRKYREEGGGLALVKVPPKLRVIFGTLGLDQVVPIRGTLEEAVASLVEGPVDRREIPERRTRPERRKSEEVATAPPPPAVEVGVAIAEPPAPPPAAERRKTGERRRRGDRRVSSDDAFAERRGWFARVRRAILGR